MTFKEYNFPEYIVKTLKDLNFNDATTVQEKVIPLILKNKNTIVQSNTGTGKTLAFLLPILSKIDFSKNIMQAIIFSPTRELSFQILELLKLFQKNNKELRIKKFIGGNDSGGKSISNNFHIAVGTPIKIRQYFEKGIIKFSDTNFFVFDEFDMIYDLGFLNDISFLISGLKNKNKINFSAFSATIPQEVKIFFDKYMKNTKYINLVNNTNTTNLNIDHILIPTKHRDSQKVLNALLNTFNPYLCLIFVNRKEDIDDIFNFLVRNNYEVCKIHGGLQARERKQILKRIHNLRYKYIVCTDIMARGLDIDGVSHIISIDLPSDLNYYIHRSGRTGRHNYKGFSYVLTDYKNINKVNELIKKGIKFSELYWNDNSFSEKENPNLNSQNKKRDKILWF